MTRCSPAVRGIVLSASDVPCDITGRRVMDLAPGPNDVRHPVPGAYFVRLEAGGTEAQQKLLILR
jgi:hypothetical protein